MPDKEMTPTPFVERDSDHYVLTTEPDEALETAWRVLQALELRRHGTHEHYGDKQKVEVLDSLRNGVEHRPYGGIFAVEIYESPDVDGQVNLLVSNRNGRHDNRYSGLLKEVVSLAGENKPTHD